MHWNRFVVISLRAVRTFAIMDSELFLMNALIAVSAKYQFLYTDYCVMNAERFESQTTTPSAFFLCLFCCCREQCLVLIGGMEAERIGQQVEKELGVVERNSQRRTDAGEQRLWRFSSMSVGPPAARHGALSYAAELDDLGSHQLSVAVEALDNFLPVLSRKQIRRCNRDLKDGESDVASNPESHPFPHRFLS